MSKILTICVPAYNAETTLGRCIQSMTASSQTSKLEILIIDDGSQDGTGVLADTFAQQYPDTVRVIHKANGGWGTVVNMAVQQADGTFFRIVDADDWVSSDGLSQLIMLLETMSEDTDVVTSHYWIYDENTSQLSEVRACSDDLEEQRKTFHDMLRHDYGKWKLPIHTLTYRTALLRAIPLNVNDRYYADLEYVLLPVHQVRRVFFSPLFVSYYCRGNQGQSTSLSGYMKHYRDLMDVLLSIVRLYEPNRHDTILAPYVKDSILPSISLLYYVILHPCYLGKDKAARHALIQWDHSLRALSSDIYRSSLLCTRLHIPFIFLWRFFRFNAFALSPRRPSDTSR